MSETILVSTRKGLFTLEPHASGWRIERESFLGDHVSIAFAEPKSGTWYAALDHGHFGAKLHRSIDRGATWTECAAPVYPPKPEGHEEKDMWGRTVDWSLKKIWALEAKDGELWCGTIPGGLFRSKDGGDSWQIVDSLWNHELRSKWSGGGADFAGIHSICFDPSQPKRVTVGVSIGGVWRSDDDGQSWSCDFTGMRADYMPPEQRFLPVAQDVHRLVNCPAAPDVFWVQHHNGVFRSTDSGKTWSDVKVPPSSFGFAVAVHPTDPDTAWFVPAIKDEKRIPVGGRVVVARTHDGGQTFTLLTKGLPQTHAYDLVFRHSLDVDQGGDDLVFGSTTGNLWTSDDQGNSWHEINHLPPVYAVRFV